MQSPLMRWSAVLMMLGSLLAGGSTLAQAQVANGGDSLYCRYPSLQPGMRIRVTCRTFGEYRPVGEFVAIHGDTLMLISASYGRRIKALLDDFSLVEVSSSRVTGDAKGALVGGYVGGSLGVGLMVVLALGALASGDSKSDDELLLPVLVLGGARCRDRLQHGPQRPDRRMGAVAAGRAPHERCGDRTVARDASGVLPEVLNEAIECAFASRAARPLWRPSHGVPRLSPVTRGAGPSWDAPLAPNRCMRSQQSR